MDKKKEKKKRRQHGHVCIFVCMHKFVFIYQKALRNVVQTGPLLGKAQLKLHIPSVSHPPSYCLDDCTHI